MRRGERWCLEWAPSHTGRLCTHVPSHGTLVRKHQINHNLARNVRLCVRLQRRCPVIKHSIPATAGTPKRKKTGLSLALFPKGRKALTDVSSAPLTTYILYTTWAYIKNNGQDSNLEMEQYTEEMEGSQRMEGNRLSSRDSWQTGETHDRVKSRCTKSANGNCWPYAPTRVHQHQTERERERERGRRRAACKR